MSHRSIRSLRPGDFAELMRLEDEVFGACGESVLGPYYVRRCCEFFGETCFVAEEAGRAVGYVLDHADVTSHLAAHLLFEALAVAALARAVAARAAS